MNPQVRFCRETKITKEGSQEIGAASFMNDPLADCAVKTNVTTG